MEEKASTNKKLLAQLKEVEDRLRKEGEGTASLQDAIQQQKEA